MRDGANGRPEGGKEVTAEQDSPHVLKTKTERPTGEKDARATQRRRGVPRLVIDSAGMKSSWKINPAPGTRVLVIRDSNLHDATQSRKIGKSTLSRVLDSVTSLDFVRSRNYQIILKRCTFRLRLTIGLRGTFHMRELRNRAQDSRA
jgi:hypothetical protein